MRIYNHEMETLSINVQKMHQLFKSKGEEIPQGI